MIEVYENVFVGNQKDFEDIKLKDGWVFILAAKEPWHREALGYKGRKAPPGGEYFYARRGNRLILNLVDAEDPKYIPGEIFRVALAAIDARGDKKVLIACNQGRSRAPGIAFAWMKKEGLLGNECFKKFKSIYGEFEPNRGIREYLGIPENALGG